MYFFSTLQNTLQLLMHRRASGVGNIVLSCYIRVFVENSDLERLLGVLLGQVKDSCPQNCHLIFHYIYTICVYLLLRFTPAAECLKASPGLESPSLLNVVYSNVILLSDFAPMIKLFNFFWNLSIDPVKITAFLTSLT